ncbi:MAG: adenosine deaminase [Eubacteriales bacterium]|nr:adenosine deaminase [Eubacteriales bacterium]
MNEELLKMPKAELHCHLDGSLTRGCVERILGRAVQPEELQAEAECGSLAKYLEKFSLPLECLQTAEGLSGASKDFLLEAAKENVRYMEVRFAPLCSTGKGLRCGQVVESVLDGLAEAKKQCGTSYNVIVCAMRHHSDEENLRMLRECREYLGEGVCAADLAGDEAAWPMSRFGGLFAEAARLDYPFTIHAGECGSVQNVLDAVELGAARVGHGIAMAGHREAQKLLADRRIGVEMCPTSNLQTKAVGSAGDYPIREFMEAGLLVTVNTDNRTVSGTTLTQEMEFLNRRFGLSAEELRALMRNAAEVSFADDNVKNELLKSLR